MAELIRLENIRKSYGENEVLKNITISIQEKEFVTLLGPSGCGKTTTLRILGGFENPDSGRILFDGKDIITKPLYQVLQSQAVFQRFELDGWTVSWQDGPLDIAPEYLYEIGTPA